jgi:hypothetical protein
MSGEPSRGPVALQVRICKYFSRFSVVFLEERLGFLLNATMHFGDG